MSLPRSLTLFGAVMLVVGNVVGAGIFTTSGMLAGEVSHPAIFILVWIIGGGLTIIGALTYAELGAMFPRAGGDYQYLKEAYGPWAGFLLGWLSFWIISPGSIAALAIALVDYMPLLPFAGNEVASRLYAVTVVFCLSALNYRSTKMASSTQSVVTVGSLILLAGLVSLGFAVGDGDPAHFSAGISQSFSITDIPGSAMIAVFFTYSGWFAAAYVGSEVDRPGRNVPLALIIGTLIVTVFYTGVNAVYLYALPLSEMKLASETNVAQMAATQLFGPSVAAAISIAIILAIASCINGTVLTGARICYAMGEDGVFWSRLKTVHPKFHTPHVAVAVQGILSCALVLLGTFGELLACVVFAMMLSSIATGAAHVVLRIRKPDIQRPYRTIGYPLVPIVFVAAYTWFAASIAMAKPTTSLIGLGMALTGIPFYLWWRSDIKK
ncbi:MAG: amino acid permease [Proteobacteria bacterium]|nr:amino acid permease [Pseudomonadota bacterium]